MRAFRYRYATISRLFGSGLCLSLAVTPLMCTGPVAPGRNLTATFAAVPGDPSSEAAPASAKAAIATVDATQLRQKLEGFGGATAGIDLSSSAVADRFVATIVPLLKQYNFDGIDIDIETGLVGSGSITSLSTSQANLIRIIDGVLAAMPSNFGLTMAPETAYVTGGSVTYGSIWGAYLPIIKKYLDNGRLWWLNMQYYNGSMYGCSGDSYSAGTVQGFTVQTQCLNSGLTIQGTTIRVPYDRQVPGLPAQPGGIVWPRFA